MTSEKSGPLPPTYGAPPPAYPGPSGPQQPPYPMGQPVGPEPPQQPYQQYPPAPPPGQFGPDGKPFQQPLMHQPVGGYVPGQPTNTVIVVQQQMFRQSPVNCVCPHCHQNVITGTTPEAGGFTWLLCAGICLFGFWLGCCLIPFCVDDCQDIRHSCPNCKNTIHVFRRL